MPCTSKTGLLPSITNGEKYDKPQITTFDLPKFSTPAPFVLRPFAGVYNPFPYGCSVLCNHPADCEAKDVVRRAKETWILDGRGLSSYEGITQGLHKQPRVASTGDCVNEHADTVPEELFRKYTETDSRPITPAPTVASIVTKSSQTRRCVTPDPVSSQPHREKTLLVLDLRRSHSQETLNWVGDTVPSTVLHPSTRTPSRSASSTGVSSPPFSRKKKFSKTRNLPCRQDASAEISEGDTEASLKLKQQVLSSVKTLVVADTGEGTLTERSGISSGEGEVVKRRGKKKKKCRKGSRDNGRAGEREFQGIQDPGETQVSTMGESRGESTRPSLTLGVPPDVAESAATVCPVFTPSSFLPPDILRQLQRQLEQEDVESEFDIRRKLALEEALKTRPPLKLRHQGEGLKALQKELNVPDNSDDKWLKVPRVFSRKSARFELPMDTRLLQSMNCLDYASRYVFPSSERLVLYNQVFNQHREEIDEDEQVERVMLGKNITVCLNKVMGRALLPSEIVYLETLMSLSPDLNLDFRTFAGVAAVCERILGVSPPRDVDPPHTLEQVDFRCLDRILSRLTNTSQLPVLLRDVRDC